MPPLPLPSAEPAPAAPQSAQEPQSTLRYRLWFTHLGVVRAGSLAALRCAPQLLVAWLPSSVAGLAVVVWVLLAAGDQVTTVNGVLRYLGTDAAPLLVAAGVGLLLLVVVGAWTAGVGTVVVAGRLLERRVGGGAAVRQVSGGWWRWPLLAGLGVLCWAAVVVLVVAVVAVLAQLTRHSPGLLAVTRVLAGVAVSRLVVRRLLRYWLVVPVVALEGRSVSEALGRARWIGEGRSGEIFLILLIAGGVGGLPWVVRPLEAPLHDGWHVLLDGVVGAVAGWLSFVLLVGALTACYLNQRAAWDEQPEVDPEVVLQRLPGPARRRRAGLVAVALVVALLPGVVVAAWATVGPRQLPVLSDQVVDSGGPADFAVAQTVTGRLVVAVDDRLIWCLDRDCRARRSLPIPGRLRQLGVAPLLDGGVAVTGWKQAGLGADDVSRRDLVMIRCRPAGCDDVARLPVLRQSAGLEEPTVHDAVAARPGGGLAVVHATFGPGLDGGQWQLTLCPDVRCAAPRTVPLPAWLTVGTQPPARAVAVAVTPDNRPVVAIHQPNDDGLTIITCESADCRQPQPVTVTLPHAVPQAAPGALLFGPVDAQVDQQAKERMAVASTPEGQPVVAVPVPGGTRLVICQRADCTATQTRDVPVGTPGAWPAFRLDPQGRPSIATYQGGWVMTAACPDVACAHPVIHRLVRADGRTTGVLDLVVGSDGEPRIVWYSWDLERDAAGPLHVLVCHRHCTAT